MGWARNVGVSLASDIKIFLCGNRMEDFSGLHLCTAIVNFWVSLVW